MPAVKSNKKPSKTIDTQKETEKILALLEEHVTKDINQALKLYPLGVDTALTTTIKKAIERPIDNLDEIVSNLDKQCLGLIDNVATKYFSKHKKSLKSVYKTVGNRNLHYSIVLNTDNSKNRNEIFNFFDISSLQSILKKYPVYFQFTSDKFLEKVSDYPKFKKVTL